MRRRGRPRGSKNVARASRYNSSSLASNYRLVVDRIPRIEAALLDQSISRDGRDREIWRLLSTLAALALIAREHHLTDGDHAEAIRYLNHYNFACETL